MLLNALVWTAKGEVPDGGVQSTVPEPIESILPELDMTEYDLVLVDSSTEADRRAALIRKLADRDTGTCLVVIHDFEIQVLNG